MFCMLALFSTRFFLLHDRMWISEGYLGEIVGVGDEIIPRRQIPLEVLRIDVRQCPPIKITLEGVVTVRANCASSLFPNAPKVLEGSDVDLAIGDRQRGVHVLSTAQLVDGQKLELRIGREDHGFTAAHKD